MTRLTDATRVTVAFLACAALPAVVRGAEDPTALARQLSDGSFRNREAAMAALVKVGDPALAALDAAQRSPDPETRWRAEAAARMIRWRVPPELARRIGDAFAGYEKKSWHDRERLIMDIATVGGRAAVAPLARVLQLEKTKRVRRAAAVGLLRMGPQGLLALERHGGDTIRLPVDSASLRIQIGNGFLEEGKHERALREYRKAIEVEPKNKIAWYNVACAYSLMKKTAKAVDALRKAIEFGYDDVDWLKKDTDLDPIRQADQYKALVKQLEEKAAPADRPTPQE